tara:strand:+ start:3430 stop:4449 length:1020 start_codon:yes stop_codon:yes gene_type:complete
MKIQEITNREEWEGFLTGCKEKTFLHSWQWGEFQRLMREKVWRFGLYEGVGLKAVALVVKVKAKRGTFLLVPHGPAAKSPQKEMIIILLRYLKELSKTENASFIRINPVWQRTKENTAMFEGLGFRGSPAQMHPEASWKLDIMPSEQELQKNMRKTTRYLIRQAMKNEEITTESSLSIEDVSIFHDMHAKVSERQAFVPFSQEYLQNEFLAFQQQDQVRMFFAKYKGEVAAACFVVFWSGIAFYHHAASLPQYAKLSLPYLLQWEAIKEAKQRGCVLYDFWGYVNPQTQPSHPWAGPTLFKMGFGGNAHEYVKTQDYPLSLQYWPTAFFESIRRLRRHL